VTTWTTQAQFRQRIGITDGPALLGNQMTLTAAGTYTFTIQAGIFNLQGAGPGQSNFGLFDFAADGSATGLNAGETLGVVSSNSRVSPFNFGPATSFGGTLGSGGASINGVNASRDVSGGASAPWHWDQVAGAPGPQPTLPSNASAGSEAFVSVFRFQVVVNSILSGSDIVINFNGSAGPVLAWTTFGTNPPDGSDNNGDGIPDDGTVSFLGLTRDQSQGGPVSAYSPFSLTLHRVPAPGAMALLGLGGLIAVRRRRS